MEQLGDGTYGVVLKAYDHVQDAVVALKVLRPELATTETIRVRFEREARAAATVKSRHVVAIHNVIGATADFPQPYFVMDYVDGESLSARLRRGALQARESITICQQVARGLATAHARGVVHGDIKPDNVILQNADCSLQNASEPTGLSSKSEIARVQPCIAKITDFGIARGIDEACRRGVHVGIGGTRAYLSPEGFREPHKVDGRSDIFSLGAMLYQLLTGRLPFENAEPDALEEQVVERALVAPRQINPRISRDLEAVVLKCLAKDPEARYETAAELAEHLGRWLRGEPVPVRPHGSFELLGLWCRRRPQVAGLIAAIALLFVLGVFGVSRWQQAEFLKEQDTHVRAQLAQTHLQNALTLARQQLAQADFARPADFRNAERTLRRARERFKDDLLTDNDRALIDAELRHFRLLIDFHARFHRHADDAWLSLGEGSDDETRAACVKALDSFGVLGESEWWRLAPASHLSPNQRGALQHEARRLMLLLALMRLQQAIEEHARTLRPELSVAAKDVALSKRDQFARSAEAVLVRVRRLEGAAPVLPCRIVEDLESGVQRLLKLPRGAAASGTSPPPTRAASRDTLPRLVSEADFLFLGVIHVYLGKHAAEPAALVIRGVGPAGLDFEKPLARAEELLRRAALLGRRQYWTWWMLGRTLLANRSFADAQLAFTTCIELRPDYVHAFEQRAVILVLQSLSADNKGARAQLQSWAETDSERACSLAPYDASTYWVRGDYFRLLGKPAEVIDAYVHALILEDHPEKRKGRNLPDTVDQVVAAALKGPDNADARALAALALLGSGKTPEALAELASLVRRYPKSALVVLASARAQETKAAHAHALQDYRALVYGLRARSLSARNTWIGIEAHKGMARVLLKLGRKAESRAAWQNAVDLDPGLSRLRP
jgi:serine/threonine protein kinase